ERVQHERARRPKHCGSFSRSATRRLRLDVHGSSRPFPHPRGASCQRQAASTDKGESAAPEAQPRSRCKGASRDEIGNIKLKDQSSFSDTMNQSGTWDSTTVPGQTYRSAYTYGGAQPHAPSRIATTGPQPITIDYQ